MSEFGGSGGICLKVVVNCASLETILLYYQANCQLRGNFGRARSLSGQTLFYSCVVLWFYGYASPLQFYMYHHYFSIMSNDSDWHHKHCCSVDFYMPN